MIERVTNQRAQRPASSSIQSVERALSILFLLADSDTTLSVGQIAERLGVHISTASRLLSTLAQQNVVMLTPSGYRLGLGVLRLAHIVLGELHIRDVARPHLQQLCRDTGFTIYLAVLLNGDELFLDQVGPNDHQSRMNWIGHTVPAHTTSGGKVLLTYLPEPELTALLDGDLAANTRHTITDAAVLREHLALTKERGYAVSQDECLIGFSSVAAPIFNRSKQNVAIVSLSGMTPELSLERLHELAPRVIATANAISLELGY